jgi:DNA-binding response OmpR family regulator
MEKKKILVADDQPGIIAALTMILKADDYEVVTASTGQEALDRIDSEMPDVVLLDIDMPQPDGLEVCRLIRERKQHEAVAIMMLTAEPGESRIITALENGADDYMAKPFHTEALLAKIKEILKKAEEGKSLRQNSN